MIDMEKLKKDKDHLLDYLNENGYSSSYIDKFKSSIKAILNLTAQEEITCRDYTDLFRTYFADKWKPKTSQYMFGIFQTINRFEMQGILPDGSKHIQFTDRDSFRNLSPCFQKIILNYASDNSNIIKSRTINNTVSAATVFFSFLQKNGKKDIHDVSRSDVLTILSSSDYPQHNSTSRCGIRNVLQSSALAGDIECSRILKYIPKAKKEKRIFNGLTDDEIRRIDQGLNQGILSLRDTAILTTMRFTGLRASDVATLKLTDIDWEHETISKCQSKTNQPVYLPLLVPVGNAIFDYLKKERPISTSPYIFLTERAPHRPMTGATITKISMRSLPKLNVRTSNEVGKGSHLFRHYVATSLLKEGESQPLISSTLGQSNPHSLNSYLEADAFHLKECSKSIEDFPVGEDVFRFEKK